MWTPSQRRTIAVLVLIAAGALALKLASNPRPMPDPPPDAPRSAEVPGTVDPNTADWPTLAAVPGLSVPQAKAIVAYRDDHARSHPGERAFRSVEDLDKVKGIGPATIEAIRTYLALPAQP
jgi:competence protein ComEA